MAALTWLAISGVTSVTLWADLAGAATCSKISCSELPFATKSQFPPTSAQRNTFAIGILLDRMSAEFSIAVCSCTQGKIHAERLSGRRLIFHLTIPFM